jgi:hypothetical protein
MKICVVSESAVDEVAIRILAEAVLRTTTESIEPQRLRARGWPSVLNLLPAIIKHLYYNTEADGLAIVADSDDSRPHEPAHDHPEPQPGNCRLCQLRHRATEELNKLSCVPDRKALKIAIGLAVPSIEAWYRAGIDPHVNEIAWGRKLIGESITYNRRSLKDAVYGSDRAPRTVMIAKATEAATRLSSDLEVLSRLFPNGFGHFLKSLRDWQDTDAA